MSDQYRLIINKDLEEQLEYADTYLKLSEMIALGRRLEFGDDWEDPILEHMDILWHKFTRQTIDYVEVRMRKMVE